MVLYNLAIYSRSGRCIFLREWRRESETSQSLPPNPLQPLQSPSGPSGPAESSQQRSSLSPSDVQKLTFGLLLALRNICPRLTPQSLQPLEQGAHSHSNSQTRAPSPSARTHSPAVSLSAAAGSNSSSNGSTGSSGCSFFSYATNRYRLHCLETPTALKFVCTSEPQSALLREFLNSVYSQFYVELVAKNPLCHSELGEPIQPIGSLLFAQQLEEFVRRSPVFSSGLGVLSGTGTGGAGAVAPAAPGRIE